MRACGWGRLAGKDKRMSSYPPPRTCSTALSFRSPFAALRRGGDHSLFSSLLFPQLPALLMTIPVTPPSHNMLAICRIACSAGHSIGLGPTREGMHKRNVSTVLRLFFQMFLNICSGCRLLRADVSRLVDIDSLWQCRMLRSLVYKTLRSGCIL